MPSLPIIRLPDTHLSPLLYYMVYCTQFQASTKQPSCRVSLLKNKSPPIGLDSPVTRIHASRALSVVDTVETSDLGGCLEQKLSTDASEENTFTNKIQLYSSSEFLMDKNEREQQRRRKIALANKGKVPWNKGRKHSPETLELISWKTKAALKDPKIRKKMTVSHVLSDQSKAKMSSSLKRVWGKRLEWKRSRAKFLSSWAESIAEAAKRGGSGQRELHWDSYDKMKEEILIEQCQLAADQAKAKEMAKEKRMARLAQKRKEKEQKAKPRGKRRCENNRKSKEEREELAIAQGLELKERLTKLHKRKTSANGQISSEDQQAWEKIDLEFIKKEQIRRQVSLADQIRAAKAKRVEYVARERWPTALPLYSESE